MQQKETKVTVFWNLITEAMSHYFSVFHSLVASHLAQLTLKGRGLHKKVGVGTIRCPPQLPTKVLGVSSFPVYKNIIHFQQCRLWQHNGTADLTVILSVFYEIQDFHNTK